MANTKLSAFFSLLLVFISGVVVGGFSYRVYNTSVVTPPRPPEKKQDPEEYRKQLIAEMAREVHLDDQQVSKLQKIYDGTRERFNDFNKKRNGEARAIWDDQTAQVKALLRPDQLPLYEALRARKDAEREANDRKRSGRRKGMPPGENKGDKKD